MKPFNGFPARMQFTSIPNIFFSQLLPQISDTAELKVTLYILARLYGKRGYPRFVSFAELINDPGLMNSLKGIAASAKEALEKALEMATQRGTFLHLALDSGGQTQDIYFLNSQTDRQAIDKIEKGELELPGLKARVKAEAQTEELPNIFSLYEENIGLLTPMIAEELKEAEKLYPIAWIGEAIKEAVSLNKRNWRYIARILENWSREGKSHGAYQRDSKKEDPDKYIKGRYGHMVRR